MQDEKSIYDKPIYQILQYLSTIVLANIYFLLSNFLVLIYWVMVIIEPEAFSVFTFMLLLIPSGPAITALCSTMGKLVRENECSITKEYFKAYKSNFKQSLILSTIGIIGAFVALLDYKFFVDRGNLLGVVFIALAVYIAVVAVYAFPILSKVEMSKKRLISVSFYYSIKKLPITLLKMGLITVAFFISSNMNIITVTCIFSLICYLIMLCDNSMLLEIESQITSEELRA